MERPTNDEYNRRKNMDGNDASFYQSPNMTPNNYAAIRISKPVSRNNSLANIKQVANSNPNSGSPFNGYGGRSLYNKLNNGENLSNNSLVSTATSSTASNLIEDSPNYSQNSSIYRNSNQQSNALHKFFGPQWPRKLCISLLVVTSLFLLHSTWSVLSQSRPDEDTFNDFLQKTQIKLNRQKDDKLPFTDDFDNTNINGDNKNDNNNIRSHLRPFSSQKDTVLNSNTNTRLMASYIHSAYDKQESQQHKSYLETEVSPRDDHGKHRITLLNMIHANNVKENLDTIYNRGREKRTKELEKRKYNLTDYNPFNPWGPIYIWDWFSPDYNCPSMERIGNLGDGGKWVCGLDFLKEKYNNYHEIENQKSTTKPTNRRPLMYSYGVNQDLSFELEMIERTGCLVHAYDPTVGTVPPDCKDNENIVFHKLALGPETKPDDTFLMVEHLFDSIKQNGHTYVDILKVDIEGSEWDTFASLLKEKYFPFGQLLIELHFRDTVEVFEFFDNMEVHGFRIFSRETNHNPCSAGKKPIAVEFSLINPHNYYSTYMNEDSAYDLAIVERNSKTVVQSRPEYIQPNGAISILTHRNNIHRLAKMLTLFYKNFNQYYDYPIVIFHEDFDSSIIAEIISKVDFPPSFLAQLKDSTEEEVYEAKERALNLKFRQIEFAIPAWLDKSKIPERTPCSFNTSTIGYRHMNRFLSYEVSKILHEEMGYEWLWRLDDDSYIHEPIGYDVFRLMKENNKLYGYTNIVQDDAKCVMGLWEEAERYIDTFKLQPSMFSRWTKGAVFYNNFEISHASVWLSDEYRMFFNHIDQNGGIYYHRWGDAPIRSIGVSLFLDNDDIHHFSDIAYEHAPFINRKASGYPEPGKGLFDQRNLALGEPLKAMKKVCTRDFKNQRSASSSSSTVTAHIAEDGSTHHQPIAAKGVNLPFTEDSTTVISPSEFNNGPQFVNISAFNSSGNGTFYHIPSKCALEGYMSGVIYITMDKHTSIETMAQTLKNFDTNFVQIVGTHYPLAVFGRNLDVNSKATLRASTNLTVDFYAMEEIVDSYPIPDFIDQSRIKEEKCGFMDTSLSDKHTNRFYASKIHDILHKKYEWTWRLSPDGKLTEKLTFDPIAKVASEGKKYGYLTTVFDDKSCIETFDETVNEYIDKRRQSVNEIHPNIDAENLPSTFEIAPSKYILNKNINKHISTSEKQKLQFNPTFHHDLPSGMTFYRGFEVTHRDIVTSKDYKDFFDFLDTKGGIYYERWNEANIVTAALSLFTPNEDTMRLSEIGYTDWPFVETRSQTVQKSMKPKIVSKLEISTSSIKVKTEALDEKYNSLLFKTQRNGYLGSDVATSIELPKGSPYSYVWLMGDTVIGSSLETQRLKENYGLVHNSLAFLPRIDSKNKKIDIAALSSSDVYYYWNFDENRVPKEAFASSNSDESILYWPVTGVSLDYDGQQRLVLFAEKVKQLAQLDDNLEYRGLNFEVIGTSILAVTNPTALPSQWKYSIHDMPNTNGKYNWNSGISKVKGSTGSSGVITDPDEEVYVIGTVGDRGLGVHAGNSFTILGKWRAADIFDLNFDAFEVFMTNQDNHNSNNGDREVENDYGYWLKGLDNVNVDAIYPILPVSLPETSLSYDEDLAIWYMLEVDYWTAQIKLWHTVPGASIISTWKSSIIYNIPEPYDNVHEYRCYAGKSHPGLTLSSSSSSSESHGVKGKEIIISYVCNGATNFDLLWQEGNINVYNPNFIRLGLTKE